MCVDIDLFGEVVVTYDDVELWLRAVPRKVDGVRENHVKDYINNYNVVCKIKSAKLDGSFYYLCRGLSYNNQNLSQIIYKLLKPPK